MVGGRGRGGVGLGLGDLNMTNKQNKLPSLIGRQLDMELEVIYKPRIAHH